MGRAQGGEGSRTGQGVQDLHDGAGLGDARKVVDDQRHEEGAAPGEHDGDAAEDSSPGDGRDGVVEDQVALLGAEAAVGFGHLCCLEGVFGGLAGDPNGWIGVVFFEILEEGAGRGGSWKFVDSGLAFCWSLSAPAAVQLDALAGDPGPAKRDFQGPLPAAKPGLQRM